MWEVERSPRRAAQPLGHRSPATVRAVAHWRQPCIGTAPRLASAASAVALSSVRRWLAGAAPALRDRPDASSGVPEPWSLARGVCATAVLLATLGRRCAVARLALQPMRASRQRAGVACTSRRALHPRLRRPSRPPFPWRAVPVRAPEPYPDRTQAGAARGSEAGASADGSQQARAGGACTSRRALYPHVRRRSRPPLPWLALPERPALSQTATVRFLPPQARVVLVSRRGARVARCGIAQPRDRRVDGVCSRWACVYGPGCNTLGIGDWYRGGLWRVGVA